MRVTPRVVEMKAQEFTDYLASGGPSWSIARHRLLSPRSHTTRYSPGETGVAICRLVSDWAVETLVSAETVPFPNTLTNTRRSAD